MSNELYRDFIDRKADAIINSLGGTITPAPANAELYRDFLNRKFDDVINAVDGVKVKSITWKGNGQTSKVITFPVTPKVILCIGNSKINTLGITTPIAYNFNMFLMGFIRTSTGNNNIFSSALSYNGNEMTITGTDASRAFNYNNEDFMLYYI